MKLGLGTSQFGQDYGVANARGRVPQEEVRGILKCAATAGIRVLDTAEAYGDGETVLGASLPAEHGFRIVTKLLPPPGAADDNLSEALAAGFERSLARLRQTQIFGLMAHRADSLLAPGGKALVTAMQQLRDRGLVRKIGVSIYRREQIEAVVSQYDIDIIQVPLNILDQRLLRDGSLSRLKERGVEIHARSAFLQGLLVMEPSRTPAYFERFRGHLSAFQKAARHQGISPLAAALCFVADIPEVDVVVCGVDSVVQLRELVEIMQTPEAMRLPEAGRFAVDDEALVNPARWKLQ